LTAWPPCAQPASVSPVSAGGAANYSTRASSSVHPVGIAHGGGSDALLWPGGASESMTSPALDPDTRTTATPARPGAVDNAKMVGGSAMHFD
jgi:hypothetical protein